MEDKEPYKESKRYENSDYPSGSLEAALKTDRKPLLRLEREPSQRVLPREEFDEMVPEFMHRGFFRSEEGPALEPSGQLGSNRPDWESDTLEYSRDKIVKETAKEPLVSLRAPASAQRQTDELPPEPPRTEPEPEEVERELKPLVSSRPRAESVQPKSNLSPESPKAEPQPLRTPTPPVREPEPEPSGGGPPEPPSEKETSSSKVSGPLVLLLLVVVALFVWRERTRPGQVAQEQPLPVPTVKVVEVPVVQQPTAPPEESPYPAMSPIATVVDSKSPQGESEAEDLEPSASPETEDGTADEMAAQRAAILNGVPDPDDTGEAPQETAPPEEVPSVTPAPTEAEVARTAPQPPVQNHTIPEPWRTEEEPATGSLFPGIEEPPAPLDEPDPTPPPQEPVAAEPPPPTQPAVVQTPAPVIPKLPTIEGDPYKIAEPEL